MITEFESAAFPAASGGGQVLLSYEAGKGFLLVSHFRHSDEVLRFSGQYQADTGKYVFYMFGGHRLRVRNWRATRVIEGRDSLAGLIRMGRGKPTLMSMVA